MNAKHLLGKIVIKCGKANLIAGAILLLGWFALTSLAIQIPFLGTLKFTFWQVLGLVNSSNLLEAMDRGARSGAGFYGLLAFLALAAPFVHVIWKDKRAVWGGAAPLLFILIVWIMVRHGMQSSFTGNGASDELSRQALEEAMSSMSLGFGAYLSFLASAYFAFVAVKQALEIRAAGTAIPASSNTAVI